MNEAALTLAVAAPVPLVWTLLGYPFEAGAMIAALLACAAVRFWAASTSGHFRWAIDLPVSLLSMIFTAGIVVHARPEPFWAMVYGTGIGAMGATIISLAMGWVRRTTDVFSPPPTPRDPTAETVAKLYAGEPPAITPDMAEQLGKLNGGTKP